MNINRTIICPVKIPTGILPPGFFISSLWLAGQEHRAFYIVPQIRKLRPFVRTRNNAPSPVNKREFEKYRALYATYVLSAGDFKSPCMYFIERRNFGPEISLPNILRERTRCSSTISLTINAITTVYRVRHALFGR